MIVVVVVVVVVVVIVIVIVMVIVIVIVIVIVFRHKQTSILANSCVCPIIIINIHSRFSPSLYDSKPCQNASQRSLYT